MALVLAGFLWHLGLYKQYRSARYRSYGLTPRQTSIRLLRAQLNRAEKLRILWRDNFFCHICHKKGWWRDMEVNHQRVSPLHILRIYNETSCGKVLGIRK